MAGPLKSGESASRDYAAINALGRDHRLLARNEVVGLWQRTRGRKIDFDGGVQRFQLVSTQDDYLLCYAFNGATPDTSAQIPIAKEPEHRISLTGETLLGVGHTYTYSPDPGGDPDNKIRHDNDGASTEDQRIVPPWAAGQIIYAQSADTKVNDGSGNPISLIVFANSRQWGGIAVASRAITLCAGFTPAGTGADKAEHVVPFSTDGATSLTWTLRRVTLRVGVAGGAPALTIEKSTGTGVFSAVAVGNVTLASGAYEASATTSLGTVASGDKLRFNVGTLATATSWTVMVELSSP